MAGFVAVPRPNVPSMTPVPPDISAGLVTGTDIDGTVTPMSVATRAQHLVDEALAMRSHTAGHVNLASYLPPGYVTDGSVDYATNINEAFAETGKVVKMPKGTFRFDSNLTPPVCAAIVGEGEYVTILKAGAAVTKALSVGGSDYASRFSDFQIDGTLTTNATGAFFGDAASVAVHVQRVRVVNFTGASGVGIRIGDVLKSNFEKVTASGSTTNLHVKGVSSFGFPTTLLFDTGVFAGGAVGLKWESGEGVTFRNTDFESNSAGGVILLPAGGAAAVHHSIGFESCWWEDNWHLTPTQYQFLAGDGTDAGGSDVTVAIRDGRFATNAGVSARAIRMSGSAIRFVVQAPRLRSAGASDILIDGGAYGEFPEWPPDFDFASIVVDASNKAAQGAHAQARSYTPTVADSSGLAWAVAPTINIASYVFHGRPVSLVLDVSGTVNAGANPTYLTVTVPTNLTPGAGNTYGAAWVNIAGTWQAGVALAYTDGKVYIRKADNSGFGLGVAVQGRVQLTYFR